MKSNPKWAKGTAEIFNGVRELRQNSQTMGRTKILLQKELKLLQYLDREDARNSIFDKFFN